MLKFFLEICLNDWGGGYGINVKGVFNNLIEGKKLLEISYLEVNFIVMMRFCWKVVQGVDNFVVCFGFLVFDK